METPLSLRFASVLIVFPYPFVLMADLMSIAGEPSHGQSMSMMHIVLGNLFVYGTMAYPVVYLTCYIIWRARRSFGRGTSALVCSIPLIYFLAPFLTMLTIGYIGQRRANQAIVHTTPASLPAARPR